MDFWKKIQSAFVETTNTSETFARPTIGPNPGMAAQSGGASKVVFEEMRVAAAPPPAGTTSIVETTITNAPFKMSQMPMQQSVPMAVMPQAGVTTSTSTQFPILPTTGASSIMKSVATSSNFPVEQVTVSKMQTSYMPQPGQMPVTSTITEVREVAYFDNRRFDPDRIQKELAEIETRSFPSPYPVSHSIPDTYAYDLQMQPLAIDFNDRNLLISNTKKKSKDDQATLLLQMQKERDYYETLIPNLKKKREKLDKDVRDRKQMQNFQNNPEYQMMNTQLMQVTSDLQTEMQEIEQFRTKLMETDPEMYNQLYPEGAPALTLPVVTTTASETITQYGNMQEIVDTESVKVVSTHGSQIRFDPAQSTDYRIPMPKQTEEEQIVIEQREQPMPQYPTQPQFAPPPGYPMPPPGYPMPPPGYYPPPPPGYYPPGRGSQMAVGGSATPGRPSLPGGPGAQQMPSAPAQPKAHKKSAANNPLMKTPKF